MANPTRPRGHDLGVARLGVGEEEVLKLSEVLKQRQAAAHRSLSGQGDAEAH